MANGLLNQLLLQQSEQTAPVQKRFNLQDFLTGAVQMSNQIARQEERQRQNSLRNLIAAREKEGIGFDQLSNEAAKYDMNAANSMRNEFRDSWNFNQKQSDTELARFKREMADYWFGEVLRRAGQAGLGPDQLKYITYEAASMIAPYDSALAERLLLQSESAYAGEEKRRIDELKAKKPKRIKIKDDRQAIHNYKSGLEKTLLDENSVIDPEARKELEKEIAACDYILKNIGSSKDYPVYLWMLPYLRSGNWAETAQKIKDSIDWQAFMDAEVEPQHPYDVNKINVTPTELSGKVASIAGGAKDSALVKENEEEKSDTGNKYDYLKPRRSNWTPGTIYDPVEDLEGLATEDIIDASKRNDLDDLRKIRSALQRAENKNTKLNVKPFIEDVNKQIARVEKDVKDELDLIRSDGKNVTEDDFIKFKKLFGQRASMGTLRQFMNFNSGVASFYTDSPMTSLVNWLLVAEPNYKPTVDEFKQARRLQGDVGQEMQSVLAMMNVPVLSKWADFKNDKKALIAAAMGSINVARQAWESLLADKDPEERKEAEKFMKKMFRIGPEAMAILRGEYDLASTPEEYDRELAKRKKARKKLPVYSIDNESRSDDNSSSTKYTKKSWEDFE